MKRNKFFLVTAAGFFLLVAGCNRNEQAKSAAELEKVFQVKDRVAGAAQPTPASPDTSRDQPGQVQQEVSNALSAMKTNGYADAYVTLRAVQASPDLTVDQVIAVQNARRAIENNVAAKAAAGDPAALRAVEAIKGASRH
jgi:hypothetical protein